MTQLTHRPEHPIENKDEDKLERGRFIERLTDAIINRKTKRSTGIVVGITGPWGCGKSSVLNLLKENIATSYDDALVVNFNPWIVSGRDDIIAQFFRELIAVIGSGVKKRKQLKNLTSTIFEYGAKIAPVANILFPGAGEATSAIFSTIKDALLTSESLTQLRSLLIHQLDKLNVPIVVLIDEIDRVEDDEIRSVVQLVRAVADFPRISYVLAYDAHRVAQALGSGRLSGERAKNGRQYLEKIVQFQIPMPITFREEMQKLIFAGLDELREEASFADNYAKAPRLRELVEILSDGVIETLRDIHRLLGTFHALIGMLKGEVDTIDVLGYSALLVKAAATVSNMRRDPSIFLGDMVMSAGSINRFFEEERLSPSEKLARLIDQSEQSDSIFNLIQFLVPSLKSPGERSHHPDAFGRRRPFLTALRLGLVPGEYSRNEVREIVKGRREEITAKLQDCHDRRALSELIDRIAEIYMEIVPECNEIELWAAIATFIHKPNLDWRKSRSLMPLVARDFCEIVEEIVKKEPAFRVRAAAIFAQLREEGDMELTFHWLNRHFFVHGIFSRRKNNGGHWFFEVEQTKNIAREMSSVWRDLHLSGELIPSLWSASPLIVIEAVGMWDGKCREQLNKLLDEDDALVSLAILFFGGNEYIGASSIKKLCDYDLFVARAKRRLEAPDAEALDETARAALRDACGSVDAG